MNENINTKLLDRSGKLVRSGYDGISIVTHLTDIVDALVKSHFNNVINSCTNDNSGLALVAVGGYGRKEIVPFSDIDIMLLSKNRNRTNTETAETIFYQFWDAGINISHSFRTLSDCNEDSSKDITIRTSIMESRFIAGSTHVFDEFKRDVYQKLVFKGRKDFVGKILREIDTRHNAYGGSIYLLEPNIKEGRGGLRDIHSILWLAKAVFRVSNFDGLKKEINDDDYRKLLKAYGFLLKTRACLHLISQRKNDVLSFEFQEPVARMFGLKNTASFLSAEIFMRLYYRRVKNITDLLSNIMSKSGRAFIISLPVNFIVKKIADDFYISKNEIIVKDSDVFKDADKIMEAFYLYSNTGRNFSLNVKENIKHGARLIERKTQVSKKAVSCFMGILKGDRVFQTLKEMHDTGVLDKFIPEFGRLRHLVIYEPYHRYTVDEHTLIALKNAEQLRSTRQKNLQYLGDILTSVKQDILFLSILLHDIGKGVPQKTDMRHDDEGYLMIKGITERFNLDHADRREIEFLVRNHIVLSKLALTRDTDASETVAQLAEIVENEENLNALYLMTYADMTAVNPNFWTKWKEYLFHEIYTKTKDHLSGTMKKSFDTIDDNLNEFIRQMPRRYLISSDIEKVRTDYKMAMDAERNKLSLCVMGRRDNTTEITLVAHDTPGLFFKFVGVLSACGLNILSARLFNGSNGLVVDRVVTSNWNELWWQGMEEQLNKDMRKAVFNKDVAHDKDFYNQTNVKSNPAKRFESFIEMDNETSEEYTILELFTSDRIGLLYDISKQFYRHSVGIISAVINTDDCVAHDVFYLQYNGGKLDAAITMEILNSVVDKL